LAELMKAQHPRLAEELSNIKFVNVGVINLQYNNPNLLGNNTGFGVLVPPIEQLPILGVIFDSCCFDIKNSTVLTAMVGGRWFEDYFGQNPTKEQLLDTVLKNVDKILGIKEKPDLYNVNILHKCIPQYVTGHLKRVENIKNYIRDKKLPLSLAGASYDGVGVNDVIFSSKELVQGLELEC
jgi:oxygen-dependent protoporphyrinogen oxidase